MLRNMEPSGIAVVTGAGRGIGRAVAIELARRGFDVVATMRDVADGKDLRAVAGEGTRLRVDRLDVNDVSTMNLPTGLRVLVNNAGVESENLPLEVMPADAWRTIFETNVFGLVEVTKHAIPLLRESGGGVICNVTSSSMLAPVPFLGAYRSSKAAVSAIGESLQAEVAQFGIRVLEIMPGPIETDMLIASDKPSPAIEHDLYRAQAEQMWEGRQRIRDMYTPTAEAARRIADAILDDDAPLRAGCDDMSEGMLTAWRNSASDEAWMRPLLASFGGGPS
jgi:NAD(P)-dependent dehydrogenase (short-subunit alcohol dehydrogenase family)